MAGLSLGRLNNHTTSIQIDGRVVIAPRNSKLDALIHLHFRTISQLKHGMRSAAGADVVVLAYFVSRLQWLLAPHTHAIRTGE